MKYVYFRLHFIYPSGKPMPSLLLCCQGLEVDDYSFALGRLKLGHPRLSLKVKELRPQPFAGCLMFRESIRVEVSEGLPIRLRR